MNGIDVDRSSEVLFCPLYIARSRYTKGIPKAHGSKREEYYSSTRWLGVVAIEMEGEAGTRSWLSDRTRSPSDSEAERARSGRDVVCPAANSSEQPPLSN